MRPRYVPDPVRFPLALLRAKGALKLRLFAALVRQVPLQRVLANVAAAALLASEVAANTITGRSRLPFRLFIVLRPHKPRV